MQSIFHRIDLEVAEQRLLELRHLAFPRGNVPKSEPIAVEIALCLLAWPDEKKHLLNCGQPGWHEAADKVFMDWFDRATCTRSFEAILI